MNRPGYGTRHPDAVTLLATLTPLAVSRVTWPGFSELEVASYRDTTPLPDFLVTSVRCIVRVGDRVVVCHTPNGPHILRGGRREPGESHTATACREVHEETGWLLDEDDLRPIGFLHHRTLDPVPADHPYPHPDFLQLVYTAHAVRHAGGKWSSWSDTEGWEQRHDLLTVEEVRRLPVPSVHLSLLSQR